MTSLRHRQPPATEEPRSTSTKSRTHGRHLRRARRAMDASTAGTGQRGHHVASQARQQEPFCVVGLAVPSHADAGSYDAAVMVPARRFREPADQYTRTDGPVLPANYASNVVDLLATGRLLGSRRDRLLPPGIPVFVQKFSGLAYSDKDKYTKKISYSNTILTIHQAACFSMLQRGYRLNMALSHCCSP